MLSFRAATLLALFAAAVPAHASAQDVDPDRQPIGRFAADVRGVFANYYDDFTIAPSLGVTQDNIVKRGLGVAFGANVYPMRLGRVTVGVGGEMMFSRGSNTVQLASEADPKKKVDGPTVGARLSAVLPQVSLNFGRRAGWSYVSGGFGWVRYSTHVEKDGKTGAPPAQAPDPAAPRTRMLHYGGGARWFAKERLAFCFDIRFYAIGPQPETSAHPALARKRLVMLSAGVSVR